MTAEMSLNDYQQRTATTAVYPEAGIGSPAAINYCLVALGGEVGEALNKWKKFLRGDSESAEDLAARKRAIAEELGDILWYLSQGAAELGFTLEQVARMNLVKLTGRDVAGTLKGDGDHR